MAGFDVDRSGLRSWRTAALAAGCLSLVFLPGCRLLQRPPSQSPAGPAETQAKSQVEPTAKGTKHRPGKHAKAGQNAQAQARPVPAAAQPGPAQAKPVPAAAKVQPKSEPQDVKVEAAEAGNELKDTVKELQATLSGDDSMVADTEMVNINYATMKKLETLPGISKDKARMIMDNRPYNTPLDLVYKKVLTQGEYERIQNRLVTWDNLWTNSD